MRAMLEGVVLQRHRHEGATRWLHLSRQDGHRAENRSRHGSLFGHPADRVICGFCADQQSGCHDSCAARFPGGTARGRIGGGSGLQAHRRAGASRISNVPHDIPVSRATLRAARRSQPSGASDVSDFDPAQIEFSRRLAIRPKPNRCPPQCCRFPLTAPTVELAEGAGISVPDLTGKTVRQVTEICVQLGVNPVLVGAGTVQEQSPPADAPVRRWHFGNFPIRATGVEKSATQGTKAGPQGGGPIMPPVASKVLAEDRRVVSSEHQKSLEN